MDSWFMLDTFEPESIDQDEERGCAQTRCADPFQVDPSNYERQIARNTFMNRFECDPSLTPYDADAFPFGVQAAMPAMGFRPTFDMGTAARNYYEGPVLGAEPAKPNFSESFVVKNGVTTRAVVTGPVDRLAKTTGSHGIDMVLPPGEAVSALQGGLVVYSSRRPTGADRIDLNGHIVPVGDLSRYEGDVVIVQSWDEKVKGVRYHIYSGLDAASVVAGDRIKAGQQIGKADRDGLHYEVRRQTVQGPVVEIEPRKGN
ncbi:MAG TPA: M23 family metallopeptidase [Candidatus Obscuribacterales bacterium]